MTTTLVLKRVTEEITDDSSSDVYTVSVIAIRDGTEDVIGRKTFQVISAADLKNKVKPLFESIVAVEKRNEAMAAIAQGVLDEIMSEVNQ